MWSLKNDNMLSQQQGVTVAAFLNECVFQFFDATYIWKLDYYFSIIITGSVFWEGMPWIPMEKKSFCLDYIMCFM